jgi:hypothetical protein
MHGPSTICPAFERGYNRREHQVLAKVHPGLPTLKPTETNKTRREPDLDGMNTLKRFTAVAPRFAALAISAMAMAGCSSPTKTIPLNDAAVVCVKPNGKHYGLPVGSKCLAPAEEAKTRPQTGFLNMFAGRGINYDTAKAQGERKTKDIAIQKFTTFFLKEAQGQLASGIDPVTIPSLILLDEQGDKAKSLGIYDKLYNMSPQQIIAAIKTNPETQKDAAFWAKVEKERTGKETNTTNELSSASGIKSGAALAALEELESTRANLVDRALRENLTGPEVAAYLKDQMRPTVVSVMSDAGASPQEIENAIRYVNQGIDANLNP